MARKNDFSLFQIVTSTLLDYLVTAFGENLSKDGANAWKKLLDILLDTVAKEQKKLIQENSTDMSKCCSIN